MFSSIVHFLGSDSAEPLALCPRLMPTNRGMLMISTNKVVHATRVKHLSNCEEVLFGCDE